MLKDRGKMKWTPFMLPEHVEWLKRVWEEDEKVSKPMLDPQEIETINRQLIEASKTKSLVKLTVYENGSINEYEGTIRALSSQTNTVIIKAKKEIAIPFKNVLRSEEHTSELQSRFDLVC